MRRRTPSTPPRSLAVGAAVLAAAGAAGAVVGVAPGDPPVGRAAPLVVAGLVGSPGLGVSALAPAQSAGSYVPGSSVLRRPDGTLALAAGRPDTPYVALGTPPGATPASREATAQAAVNADRRWLGTGTVPGRSADEREMAARALLDLRLLQRPSGAVVAAERRHWRYVWPRDAAWVAVALARTGHPDDARRTLDWLAAVQEEDGTWGARYLPTEGEPVPDGRPAQLDSTGWVPWAVWSWVDSLGGVGALGPDDRAGLLRLWPAVAGAADAAAASLDGRGLPEVTPDWWEVPVDDVTVSTSGALRAGLRGAADLAGQLAAGLPGVVAVAAPADGLLAAAPTDLGGAARRERRGEQQRWAAAAGRLDDGIRAHFGATGYRRTPDAGSGADAGVAALAPPLSAYDPDVAAALLDTEQRLRAPGGGLSPGEDFPGNRSLSWTPAVGQVALAAAASGDTARAEHWLAWFAASRSSLGALPEKVDAAGRPAELAPLAWTAALVLLTLVARDEGVPAPPVSLPTPSLTGA